MQPATLKARLAAARNGVYAHKSATAGVALHVRSTLQHARSVLGSKVDISLSTSMCERGLLRVEGGLWLPLDERAWLTAACSHGRRVHCARRLGVDSRRCGGDLSVLGRPGTACAARPNDMLNIMLQARELLAMDAHNRGAVVLL